MQHNKTSSHPTVFQSTTPNAPPQEKKKENSVKKRPTPRLLPSDSALPALPRAGAQIKIINHRARGPCASMRAHAFADFPAPAVSSARYGNGHVDIGPGARGWGAKGVGARLGGRIFARAEGRLITSSRFTPARGREREKER